jgi:hypothetical protein
MESGADRNENSMRKFPAFSSEKDADIRDTTSETCKGAPAR